MTRRELRIREPQQIAGYLGIRARQPLFLTLGVTNRSWSFAASGENGLRKGSG